MPTIDKLVQGAKHLKVKEVPGYVGKFAGEHWTPEKTSGRLATWLQKYKVQNIDTGSSKPLMDVLIYGFFFSYAISWPREYAHHKAEEAKKLQAAGGSGH